MKPAVGISLLRIGLRSAVDLPRTELQPHRGWTDQEWDAATRRLTDRDLLTPDGTATQAGRELIRTAETATDQAAERPWRPLTPEQVATLTRLLTPLSTACAAALRFPNPIGFPKPTG
ncbi:helix-turn-helix domain-containing protein [Streptomyces violaceusniger]|uniref:helix-turn-helix domain-containing protein n=1 Tax=Streptomyces violaceusniger TaxID=68280 RepID=UPI003F4A85B8